MSTEDGGPVLRCEHRATDGTPCTAVAFILSENPRGTVSGLCLFHEVQRHEALERFRYMMGIQAKESKPMSESTADKSSSQCERRMRDGTPCTVPAHFVLQEVTGGTHRLCVHHAGQWRNDVDRFKRVMGVDTWGPRDE